MTLSTEMMTFLRQPLTNTLLLFSVACRTFSSTAADEPAIVCESKKRVKQRTGQKSMRLFQTGPEQNGKWPGMVDSEAISCEPL